VNFTTALPDANYSTQLAVGNRGTAANTLIQTGTPAAGSVQILNYESAALVDGAFIYAAIFR